MTGNLQKNPDDLSVVVCDAHGAIRSVFDFALLQLSPVIANGLKMAFEASLGGCTLETKRHAWRRVKVFGTYLRAAQLAENAPLPPNVLFTFRDWLCLQEVSNRYRYVTLNQVINIVLWCSRNCQGVVDERLRTDSIRFPWKKEAAKEPASYLGEVEIKAILAAAYAEIDAVVERINAMRDELKTVKRTHTLSEVARLMHELLPLDHGLFVSQSTLLKQPRSLLRRVRSLGGLNQLSTYLYPSAVDVFPFYLAVLCQCSGNPMSIRLLERDSVKDHPLRSDRRRIIWSKTRSGYEQKADFNTKRNRSAPNLIDILLQLTEPLVPFTDAVDRKRIFLAYSRGRVSVPSWQSLHNHLDEFIERHALPKFDFRDLRRAGAELHERAAGSILAAKNRLNHRSSRTTRDYVSGKALRESHDKTIAEAQNLLATEITRNAMPNAPAITEITLQSKPVETVFGFLCKDPLAGTASGTTPGALCTKFSACATCPGAIIPLDDPAIVSKLLKTAEQLRSTYKRAVEHGWIERFKVFYEPTQHVLEKELLPRVNEDIMQKALSMTDLHSIPYLE